MMALLKASEMGKPKAPKEQTESGVINPPTDPSTIDQSGVMKPPTDANTIDQHAADAEKETSPLDADEQLFLRSITDETDVK